MVFQVGSQANHFYTASTIGLQQKQQFIATMHKQETRESRKKYTKISAAITGIMLGATAIMLGAKGIKNKTPFIDVLEGFIKPFIDSAKKTKANFKKLSFKKPWASFKELVKAPLRLTKGIFKCYPRKVLYPALALVGVNCAASVYTQGRIDQKYADTLQREIINAASQDVETSFNINEAEKEMIKTKQFVETMQSN